MKFWSNTLLEKSFVLLFLCCFLLGACSNEGVKVKGEMDIKGNVIEVDSSETSILVEDKRKGVTWVALPDDEDIQDYEEGQEVAVWVDGGIDTSSPAYTKALHIEIINSK